MASKFVSFDPGKDIPSLAGKVIFTTGANTDLGKHSALELAKHNPSQISVASRNAKKGNAAVAEVKEAVLGRVRILLQTRVGLVRFHRKCCQNPSSRPRPGSTSSSSAQASWATRRR